MELENIKKRIRDIKKSEMNIHEDKLDLAINMAIEVGQLSFDNSNHVIRNGRIKGIFMNDYCKWCVITDRTTITFESLSLYELDELLSFLEQYLATSKNAEDDEYWVGCEVVYNAPLKIKASSKEEARRKAEDMMSLKYPGGLPDRLTIGDGELVFDRSSVTL